MKFKLGDVVLLNSVAYDGAGPSCTVLGAHEATADRPVTYDLAMVPKDGALFTFTMPEFALTSVEFAS